MSINLPQTQTTPVPMKQRPSTTSLLMDVDAKRKMSVADRDELARISQRIAEGFSKVPFSCHEPTKKESNKTEIPFRSIRDNALSTIENEIDQNFGSEIHKHMMKGMVLKETEFSLKLENIIDSFFEQIATYVR